jgi:hypothetical protein
MRSKKELQSKEFQTDMTKLCEMLSKIGIKYELRPHPAFVAEPQAKEILGYYPAGEWQVIINKKYSVIRGMVSSGLYEIMAIKRAKYFKSPIRFEKPEDLVNNLLEKRIR